MSISSTTLHSITQVNLIKNLWKLPVEYNTEWIFARIRLLEGVGTSLIQNTGLFEMIVGFLTTCHTQYTWDMGT